MIIGGPIIFRIFYCIEGTIKYRCRNHIWKSYIASLCSKSDFAIPRLLLNVQKSLKCCLLVLSRTSSATPTMLLEQNGAFPQRSTGITNGGQVKINIKPTNTLQRGIIMAMPVLLTKRIFLTNLRAWRAGDLRATMKPDSRTRSQRLPRLRPMSNRCLMKNMRKKNSLANHFEIGNASARWKSTEERGRGQLNQML